jgi:hypothetical protein
LPDKWSDALLLIAAHVAALQLSKIAPADQIGDE